MLKKTKWVGVENNKKAKPRRDAPREECTRVTKRGDGEEEEELVVGRAMYCNKEKSEQDKDIQAWVEVEMQTQRNKEIRRMQRRTRLAVMFVLRLGRVPK